MTIIGHLSSDRDGSDKISLFVGDLKTYEKNLIEEWELLFATVEDKIGTKATDAEKQKAAMEVLAWAEIGNVRARIKPDVSEPFITRGSLHILANQLKIGWHPNFRDLLQNILEGGEV